MDKEQQEKLIQLVRNAVQRDADLREQYQIGDKFRFVRDQLQALLHQLEGDTASLTVVNEPTEQVLSAEDDLIYVYLFNAQGNDLRSWLTLLTPKVFYEYSINRPIYADKKHIEMLIKSKANKVQHGYLTMAVVRTDIVVATEDNKTNDAMGNPLIKVKEGALRFEKFITLTHNDHEYHLNEEGQLVRKT